MSEQDTNVDTIDQFITKIQLDKQFENNWYITTRDLKKGNIIYYSDNINQRLNIKSENNIYDLHPYSKEQYDFVQKYYHFYEILLGIQGLNMIKFSHKLFENPNYQYGYYVVKNNEIDENKHIIKEANKITYKEGFLIALLIIKSNIGNIFLSKEEFIDNLLKNPNDFCQTDFKLTNLAEIFNINKEVLSQKELEELKKGIEESFSILIRIRFIDSIKIDNQEFISVSPGAFLFNELVSLNKNSVNTTSTSINNESSELKKLDDNKNSPESN